jgi:hypothetical protein
LNEHSHKLRLLLISWSVSVAFVSCTIEAPPNIGAPTFDARIEADAGVDLDAAGPEVDALMGFDQGGIDGRDGTRTLDARVVEDVLLSEDMGRFDQQLDESLERPDADLCPGGCTAEACNGLDDDGDDRIDEDVPLGDLCEVVGGLGVCAGGRNICVDGALLCRPTQESSPEVCDGLDNDCDGRINEDVLNRCGDCGEEPPEVCNQLDDDCDGAVDEGVLNACQLCGDVPADRCDGEDNDCNGIVDDGCPCQDQESQACGRDVGQCSSGLQSCVDGMWDPVCDGEVTPTVETCNDLDDDCDGEIDEALARPCGETDEGVCRRGTNECTEGVWGACENEIQPGDEVCNGADDDCDSIVDENLEQPCGSAVGECNTGARTCTDGEYGGCEGSVGPQDEDCDGQDNDCDGQADEGVLNVCGQCGENPVEVCNGQDDDCDQITDEGVLNACGVCGPVPADICDGIDNDCNGTVDDDCPCVGGTVEACGSDRGTCERGRRECVAGAWSDCVGSVGSAVEVCNGLDDDCDGQTDEEITRECGTGIGRCSVGTETCVNGMFAPCAGAVNPRDEECDDQDNDCDGTIDENLTQACGSDSGECSSGTRICDAGDFGPCIGRITGNAEVCDDLDNDCDGETDENLVQRCGSDVGVCSSGNSTCIAGEYNACAGNVIPADEACDDRDNDCDGDIDENLTQVCGTDVGACVRGLRTCGDGEFSACVDNVTPVPEVCDNIDNDCDGRTDEGLVQACGSDVGQCSIGSSTCVAGIFQFCAGNVSPSDETCDNIDNDCDGSTDEGITQTCGINVGECSTGTQACATGSFGACQGQVAEVAEVCDGNDNDCDGDSDEGVQNACGQCGAVPVEACDNIDNDCDGSTDESITQICGTNVGECSTGTRTCAAGSFGACAGDVGAEAEVCDNVDNDCDGSTDEGVQNACGQCGPIPVEVCDSIDNDCDGSTDERISRRCGTDEGECSTGIETCTRGSFGLCEGGVGPVPESCDNRDNDCDQRWDEGLPTRDTCRPGETACENGRVLLCPDIVKPRL